MKSDPQRKPGYYWVRFEGVVTIAEYKGNGTWEVCGDDRAWEDSEFCEILSDRLTYDKRVAQKSSKKRARAS